MSSVRESRRATLAEAVVKFPGPIGGVPPLAEPPCALLPPVASVCPDGGESVPHAASAAPITQIAEGRAALRSNPLDVRIHQRVHHSVASRNAYGSARAK